MNIGESLPRNAQHFPDKRAIVDAHRTVTYRELHERTNRLANYLLAQGICKGDLVGLSCGSRAEHFSCMYNLFDVKIDPEDLKRIDDLSAPYQYVPFQNQRIVGGAAPQANWW